jgi:hypothetical protein
MAHCRALRLVRTKDLVLDWRGFLGPLWKIRVISKMRKTFSGTTRINSRYKFTQSGFLLLLDNREFPGKINSGESVLFQKLNCGLNEFLSVLWLVQLKQKVR